MLNDGLVFLIWKDIFPSLAARWVLNSDQIKCQFPFSGFNGKLRKSFSNKSKKLPEAQKQTHVIRPLLKLSYWLPICNVCRSAGWAARPTPSSPHCKPRRAVLRASRTSRATGLKRARHRGPKGSCAWLRCTRSCQAHGGLPSADSIPL